MKKRVLKFFVFFIPFLALLGWLGYLELQYASAPRVMVAVSGYDPRDILSGHYLNLAPEWDKTDCRQFAGGICPQASFERVYRYYLPQNDALYLEKVLAGDNLDVKLEFALPENASPLIRGLYIDNTDWKDWMKTHSREK